MNTEDVYRGKNKRNVSVKGSQFLKKIRVV